MTAELALYPMWQSLMQSLVIAPALAEEVWVDVQKRYGENGRFYHTLTHIHHALTVAHSVRNEINAWTAVQLAVWFHDVIYDPRANDNEVQSAIYASYHLQQWQIPKPLIQKVNQLILATKDHLQSGLDSDSALFLDVDLAILGAAPKRYDSYARNIRNEYAFVAESAYRQARRQVLLSFLNRPFIFQSPTLQRRFETAARANIQRELNNL